MDSFWDFFWFMIMTFLFIGYLIVLLNIVSDLFRDRSTSGGMKAVWIVCLLFFPIITSLVYLITRGNSMAERQISAQREAMDRTESYIQSVAGTSASPSEEISKAKTLLDAGTISQEEYDALKAKALA